MKTIILVDGMNLLYKSAYSYAELQTREGLYSGSVFGILSQIFSAHKRIKAYPFRIVVVWDSNAVGKDGKRIKSWREQHIQKSYKKGRKRDELVIRALSQLSVVKEALSILGIPQVEVPGLEADDLIGMAASKFADSPDLKEVIIFSTDKDFYQCVSDKIRVHRVSKGTIEVVTPKKVLTEYGVPPKLFASYKALVGDASDKYKGIKGVGPAKAVELINAGIRPAKARWEDHDEDIIKPYGPRISGNWKDAHRCFKLAFIPRSPTYKLLPKEIQEAASKQLKDMHKVLLEKHGVTDKEKRMKEWTRLCSKYELSTFLANRRQLFQRYLGE